MSMTGNGYDWLGLFLTQGGTAVSPVRAMPIYQARKERFMKQN
jgi:hypothetical protein